MNRTLKNDNLALAIFMLLAAIVMFSNPLQIVLTGNTVLDRTMLGNSLNYFAIYPLCLMLLIVTGRNLHLAGTDLINITMLASLPISVLIRQWGDGFGFSRATTLLRLAVILSSYFLFRNLRLQAGGLRRMLVGIFAMSVVLTIGLAAYFTKNGMFTYSMSSVLGIDRPQLGGTLLQSTEMSDILGVVLLLGMCVWAVSTKRTSRFVVIIVALPVLYMFVLMGAIGSFVSLAIVLGMFLAGHAKRRWTTAIWIVCLIFALGAVYYEIDGSGASGLSVLVDKLGVKVQSDERNGMYNELWKMIKTDGFYGGGYGMFYDTTGLYPHHNILGIWSELGFFCMLAYLLQFGLCVYWSIRIVVLSAGRGRGRVFIDVAGCFCMIVLFLHLKGLVHDTWYDLTLMLYTGSMLGLCSNLKILLGIPADRPRVGTRPIGDCRVFAGMELHDNEDCRL